MADKMEREDYDEKYYLTFHGEHDKWDEWKEKFEALARKKRWTEAMENELDLETLRRSEDEDDVAMVKANDDGFYYLKMACKESAFKLISHDEDLHEAWESLLEVYEDAGADELLELAGVWSRLELDNYLLSPKILFKMMDKVDAKIVRAGGQPKTDQDKMHLIIEKMDLLGDKYRDVIVMLTTVQLYVGRLALIRASC